jgi:hypothetical protein
MIEVELPDGSIAEFPAGTSPDVIKQALSKRFAVQEPKGSLYAFGSGAVRAIPEGLDLAGAAVAEGASRLTGGDGGYFKGFMEPAMTPANDALSAVIGPEYDAQGFGENAAKMLGSVAGPIGSISAAKNIAGFIKGMGGSLKNYIDDPQKLKEIYLQWKQGLEQVPVSPKEARRELINPVLEEVGPDARFATREGKERLAEMENVLQEDGTTLAEVYALRKSLGNLKDSAIAEPIRNQTKAFMAERVGDEGLDAYRRAMTYEDTQHALRNMGNEGIKATRTKINNLDETGMSLAEKTAKFEAGRGGLAEALMRGGERALGAIPSAIVGGPAAPLIYGLGRSMGAGADKMAAGKIKALQEVLLNKRAAPNMGEKAGDKLRKVLQGK